MRRGTVSLPAPTLWERMVSVVAPKAAARMAAGRAMRSGTFGAYVGTGADGGPMSPLSARSRGTVAVRSGNAELMPSRKRMIGESRELLRTHPIAAGALATHLERIVGTGLVPVPSPDAGLLRLSEAEREAFIEQVVREWSLFADSPDCVWGGLPGENFYTYQRAAYAARWTSGDAFTLLPDAPDDALVETQPYRLRLQLLEADRIGNPGGLADTLTEMQGIRLQDGRPTHAYIYSRHPGDRLLGATLPAQYEGAWVAFQNGGRRLVLHHLRRSRPDQVRGVPALAVISQALRDLGRYTEAEITAAVVSAYYTVFVKRSPVTGSAHIDEGVDGDDGAGGSAQGPEAPGPELALDVGAIVGLADGEDVSFANPGRPNAAYSEFVRQLYAEIGVGLRLPRSLLLKVFDSSYSASRAELLDYWQHAKPERYWLQLSLCQPVWETWMDEAVATGRLICPGYWSDPAIRRAWSVVEWHGDSQGSINPKDEVAAYASAIDARLMTYERAEWELFGSDFNSTYAAKVRAIRRMQADGIAPAPKAGAAAPAAPATSHAMAP